MHSFVVSFPFFLQLLMIAYEGIWKNENSFNLHMIYVISVSIFYTGHLLIYLVLDIWFQKDAEKKLMLRKGEILKVSLNKFLCFWGNIQRGSKIIWFYSLCYSKYSSLKKKQQKHTHKKQQQKKKKKAEDGDEVKGLLFQNAVSRCSNVGALGVVKLHVLQRSSDGQVVGSLAAALQL